MSQCVNLAHQALSTHALVLNLGTHLLPLRMCPTVIWVGGEDRTTPACMARLYHAHIPGSSLRVVPGEGHLSLVCWHQAAILRSARSAACTAQQGTRAVGQVAA